MRLAPILAGGPRGPRPRAPMCRDVPAARCFPPFRGRRKLENGAPKNWKVVAGGHPLATTTCTFSDCARSLQKQRRRHPIRRDGVTSRLTLFPLQCFSRALLATPASESRARFSHVAAHVGSRVTPGEVLVPPRVRADESVVALRQPRAPGAFSAPDPRKGRVRSGRGDARGDARRGSPRGRRGQRRGGHMRRAPPRASRSTPRVPAELLSAEAAVRTPARIAACIAPPKSDAALSRIRCRKSSGQPRVA